MFRHTIVWRFMIYTRDHGPLTQGLKYTAIGHGPLRVLYIPTALHHTNFVIQ